MMTVQTMAQVIFTEARETGLSDLKNSLSCLVKSEEKLFVLIFRHRSSVATTVALWRSSHVAETCHSVTCLYVQYSALHEQNIDILIFTFIRVFFFHIVSRVGARSSSFIFSFTRSRFFIRISVDNIAFL